MIQTSFFPQPEKDEPVKIIQKIDTSILQPRKVEELLPDIDILPDTYIIYPTGGYHPFYGIPNTFPRYQLPIWPYVKRIKFSESFSSEKKLNNARRGNLDTNQLPSQLNPTFHRGYFVVSLKRESTLVSIQYTRLKKNGEPIKETKPKQKQATIHRLVATAWIPNPDPEKFDQIMHINDDPSNYLPENLKWGNAKMNAKGKKKHNDSKEQRYLSVVNKGLIKG
tara:strand:+ start:27 stop:695 length:669 start_codon:yes stop_codon:yes gene_type:complete